MSLHLVRLPLAPSRLHRWAAERGLAGRHGIDEGQALHHLLGETFGPGALQPFRLFPASRGGMASLYAYSATEPDALRDVAILAPPEHLAVVDPARLDWRPAPSLRAGRRVGFDVRLRPVVRLLRPLSVKHPKAQTLTKGAEADAFYVQRLRDDPAGEAGEGPAREEVYLEWLAARLGGAAELDRSACRLAAFHRTPVARGGRTLEGPDATIHGTLVVVDAAEFADLLTRGVGRHRAYGYGMLMLRPPGRPVPEA